MGFYGNITNTSRTTFQFDKIYPSRKDMDGKCTSDGVYNGRYVLVEYDTSLEDEAYLKDYYLVKQDSFGNQTNKLYSTIPAGKPNDFHYLDIDAAQVRLTADELNAGTKFMLLPQGHVITRKSNEVKFVAFKEDGTYTEIEFSRFIELMTFPSEEERTAWNDKELIKTETFDDNNIPYYGGFAEAAFNANNAYWVYLVNGKCYYTDEVTNASWNQANEAGTLAGLVRPGRDYEYNLTSEMYQLSNFTYQEADGKVYVLIQEREEQEDNYTQNFNQDKEYYGTSRGYDGTVWQKTFVNGIEQYVMIAELNTVVPTFGVSSDAPSLLPINPHWGADSTNVYYELHWQPQWGLRVKAADNSLLTPVLDPSGKMITDNGDIQTNGNYGKTFLRLNDGTVYPSDENVTWSSYFDQTSEGQDMNNSKIELFYNKNKGQWDQNSANEVPAAIYYNKNGLDSDVISYSSDITDESAPFFNSAIWASHWENKDTISLSPTGLSGNIYNRHDGKYGKRTQIDTQELSIMLPSIGDTIASVWDLIYGGRDTSATIARTNRRNKDISWEWGADHLNRVGLRLRGSYSYDPINRNNTLTTSIIHEPGYFIKKNGAWIEIASITDQNDPDYEYNSDTIYYRRSTEGANGKALETLAGCINTAHDLFGMIIVKVDKEEDLWETENGIRAAKAFTSSDRIYFAEDTQQYYRKAIGYEFHELDESAENSPITYEPLTDDSYLTTEIIHQGGYWIQKNGEWIDVASITDPNDPDYEYDPNKTYYYKKVDTFYAPVEGEIHSFPYNGYAWYADSKSSIIYDNVNHRYYCSFLKRDTYQAGKTYYKIIDTNLTPQNLGSDYHANTLFYKNVKSDGKLYLTLENSDEPNPEVAEYYEINTGIFAQYSLQDQGYDDVYLPGRFFFKVDHNPAANEPYGDKPLQIGTYVIDDTIDGSKIRAYGEIIQYGGKNNYICYPMNNITTRPPTGDGESSETQDQSLDLYIQSEEYVFVDYVSIQNYLPNLYYEKDEYNIYVLCDDEEFDEQKEYYVKKITYTKVTQNVPIDITKMIGAAKRVSSLCFYQDNTYFQKIAFYNGAPSEYKTLSLSDLEAMKADGSFNPQDVYTLLQYDGVNQQQSNVPFMTLDAFISRERQQLAQNPEYNYAIKIVNSFYIPNVYHYRDEDGSYILSADPAMDPTKDYYLLTDNHVKKQPTQPEINYSEENDYYYKENDQYIKIINFDENTNYGTIYVKEGIYVISDESSEPDERLEMGMEWNTDALSVPATLTLGTRSMKWIMKELPNYAIDTSTINGIILDTVETLSAGDRLTRDDTLVAGGLNKVRDIIARFNRIKSREMTIIDDMGRVHSAPIDTTQKDNNGNDKKWLAAVVNGNAAHPKVYLHHTYNPINPTTSTLDLNNVSGAVSDTLNIVTPIEDEMGHVVGHNTQTTTLPYAFGQITVGTAPNTTTVNAKHSSGTLDIIPDAWLSLTASYVNNENPKIEISHKTAQTSVKTAGEDDATISLKAGEVLKVPYLEIDGAGHVSELRDTNVTMPAYTVTEGNYANLSNSITRNSMVYLDISDNDELVLYRTPTGNLPINQVATETNNGNVQYYTLQNTMPTLLDESIQSNILANRLTQLNNTNWYSTTNTISELITTQYQRTKWLTEAIEAMDSSVTANINNKELITGITQTNGLLSFTTATLSLNVNDIQGIGESGSLASDLNNIQAQIDDINVAISNDLVYTEADPDNQIEEQRVTIQQLTTRVAQLEQIIRNLIQVDETNNSLVVMSQEEMDEILVWPEREQITITMVHQDYSPEYTEEMEYNYGDVVRIRHFDPYTPSGNEGVKYYVNNAGVYDEVMFPFNATEDLTIIETATPPSGD